MTYIYEQVTRYDMIERARSFDTGRYEQLGGYEGIDALHEYLTDLAEDIGEPIELDIIALCCDWAHYGSIIDAAWEYDHDSTVAQLLVDWNAGNEPGECEREILDWFQDQTTVLQLDNGSYLIQAF